MWWNIAEGDDPSEAGKEVKSDKKLLSSLLLENDHTMADFTVSLAMFFRAWVWWLSGLVSD